MNEERLMKLLLSPIISEKSSRVADQHRQILFKVLPDATKLEIKQAVELMFKVKVAGVQVLNVQGKAKRFGARLGRRKNFKKAYVSLKEGYDIDFAGIAG